MNDLFYVYGYKDPEFNDYIYIGKGTKNRMNTHWDLTLKGKNTHNKRFAYRLQELYKNNLKPEIILIQINMKASEAYVLEANLIQKFGRKGYDLNGCLLNHSPGFEHFNIKNFEELQVLLNDIDKKHHFNTKIYPKEMITYACDLYRNGMSQKQVVNELSTIYEKISFSKLREWLVSNGIVIRTKSDTRKGELNPAFGRRGLITKGFTGKKHTTESKIKTSTTFKNKNIYKLPEEILLEIVALRKNNISYNKIKITLNLSVSSSKIRSEYLRYIGAIL